MKKRSKRYIARKKGVITKCLWTELDKAWPDVQKKAIEAVAKDIEKNLKWQGGEWYVEYTNKNQ